jgi:asparagine synthase (glutamine-hydrolysing)
MCGIAGIIGNLANSKIMDAMLQVQKHRGPDAIGIWEDQHNRVVLGHNRLSIIDLSDNANQPMLDSSNNYVIVFNGEVYNYKEIKKDLEHDFVFKTNSDTEVVLNAFIKWGKDCLDKFIGMFAFAIWNKNKKKLFIARDRFGVKPFYFSTDSDGSLIFASEIKTILKAGINNKPNLKTWSGYLLNSTYGEIDNTFYENVYQLPGGHFLEYQDNNIQIKKWYDLVEKTGFEFDERPLEVIEEEYYFLLQESIKLRFRADVPVGINISGGIDSSLLLYLVNDYKKDALVEAFTFYTNDDRYDELPWVQKLISQTKHHLNKVLLSVEDVKILLDSVYTIQDEPYGGIPTLAYSQIFKDARNKGIIVLLDGQGMDEQWAGYDYFRNFENKSLIQGVSKSADVKSFYNSDFIHLAEKLSFPEPYPDKLRNLMFRDAFYTKIPRALRFNDRVSMMYSTELREPFLDHRLFELAFKQSPEKKINQETGKIFLRNLINKKLPDFITNAPKRPLQTPQREWLQVDLKEIILDKKNKIKNSNFAEVISFTSLEKEITNYFNGDYDNSFFIWQLLMIPTNE